MAEDAEDESIAPEAAAPLDDPASDEVAPQWVQYKDDSGESYYANVATGETSWTLPEDAQVVLLHELPDSDAVSAAHIESDGPTVVRLASEVQQQVEEARRRNGLDAVANHWVEMYDPTRDALYYYALISGDITWVHPPGDGVLQFDQDPITKTIVRIQCAIRVQLARRRVCNKKQSLSGRTISNDPAEQEHETMGTPSRVWVEVYDPVQQLLYYNCPATGETRWDPPTVFVTANENKEVGAAITIQSLARGRYARKQVERKRVEKVDREKLRQRQFEYMARPEADREADCRRELLKQETEQVQHGDQFWGVEVHNREVTRQLAEEAMLATAESFWQRVNAARRQRRGRPVDWRAVKLEEESRNQRERQAEISERETMEHEEKLQCRDGDGFWGIQADERREGLARRAMEEEDRTSQFFSDEFNDAERCAFWTDEASENVLRTEKRRAVQEKRSQTRYMRWFYQQCSSVDDLLDYLWPTQQRFTPIPLTTSPPTSSITVNACGMLPVRQSVRNEKPNRSFYKLDDLIVRERVERGDLMFGHRPILTIHHPNAAQIEARRGRFEINSVDTTGIFDKGMIEAKVPITTSPYRPPPLRSEERYATEASNERQDGMMLSKAPAVRYRRSQVRTRYNWSWLNRDSHTVSAFAMKQTPDPHIPARFNGVPFMPHQISPTRDILCSDHRKLTQLPTLSTTDPTSRTKMTKKPKHTTSPTQGRPLPSTKNTSTKKKLGYGNQESPGRRRHMSIFDHDHETVDPMVTSYGFLSPFAAERRRFSELQHQQQQKLQQVKRDADNKNDGNDGVGNTTLSAVERQFEETERSILAQVFAWMDVDDSGTVDRKEMAWALAHDHEVVELAKQSALLRVLLKDRSHLDELFTQLGASTVNSPVNNNEIGRKLREESANCAEFSCDLFLLFCRDMYVRLTNQGLLLPLATANNPNKSVSESMTASPPRALQNKSDDNPQDIAETEEHTIRRVFQLLDADGNGILERREICAALFESASNHDAISDNHRISVELSTLISTSRALQPLLHESLFMKAFTSFESADPDGICEEEFVAFCLEIAEVATVNHMS